MREEAQERGIHGGNEAQIKEPTQRRVSSRFQLNQWSCTGFQPRDPASARGSSKSSTVSMCGCTAASIRGGTAGSGEDGAQTNPPLAPHSLPSRFCTTTAKRSQMGSGGRAGPSSPLDPPRTTLARRAVGCPGPFPARPRSQDHPQHAGSLQPTGGPSKETTAPFPYEERSCQNTNPPAPTSPHSHPAPRARGLGGCHPEQRSGCWASSRTQMHIPELTREF